VTRRLLASYLLLTVVVLVILEVPLGLAFADHELDQLLSDVERDAFAIAAFVEEELEEPEAHGDGESSAEAAGEGMDLDTLARNYEDRTGGRLVIIDGSGLALADSSPPAEGERYFDERPEVARALEGEVATGARDSDTLGSSIVYVAVPVASGGTVHGVVRISYPTHEVDVRIREHWLRLGGIAVVSLVGAAALGVGLARSVTAPLDRLQTAATALGSGDLTARAPSDAGPPEVRSLARDFNDMAERLEELVRSQESFVADASHQLRTPLTALRLRLENLEAEVDPDQQRDVEAAGREVARLSRLVDGLLALARADRESGQVGAELVDLVALARERVEVWRPLAGEEDVELVLDERAPPPAARVTSDRVAQVLDNLIANAIDATASSGHGGRVGVRVAATTSLASAGEVELHVVDDGPGLSDEERERAFDRFWRASREGGRLGGSGLGLAIVEKLVRADGGTVELRAAHQGGVDAVVRYPGA
jgi:signal transduction histidine kinase